MRIAFVLCLVSFIASFGVARAASTGVLSGTVVDASTKLPIAGAHVTAASPSTSLSAVTDAKGQFVIVGVVVDTYVIGVEAARYDTFQQSGVTVTADENVTIRAQLNLKLRQIGSVVAVSRPRTSAFNVTPVERNSYDSAAIDQLLGKSFNTNQKQLLSELPSVTIDKNGTALIRGGTSFETALQVEGIDYLQPNRSLVNRFENVGNADLLNGVGSLDIIPGGGDATHGNTGTGLIALTIKRGTKPIFATVDYESGIAGSGQQNGGVAQQFGFEYGWAAKNLSNYTSFVAEDTVYQWGPYGTDPASISADPTVSDPNALTIYGQQQRGLFLSSIYNPSKQSSRDFIDNLVYKFGHDNYQSVQFFIQSQVVHRFLDYGGYATLTAPVAAPVGGAQGFVSGLVTENDGLFNRSQLTVTPGLDSPTLLSDSQQVVQQLAPPIPGGAAGQPLTAPESVISPFSAFKLEYDNSLNTTTSLGARFYETRNEQSEYLPSQAYAVPDSGGSRTGFSLDITHTQGEKHTFQLGGKFEFANPFGLTENAIDYPAVYEGRYFGTGISSIDLGPYTHDLYADVTPISPVGLSSSGSPIGTPTCLGVTNLNGTPYVPVPGQLELHCGYLTKFFPQGVPPFPAEQEIPTAKQQSYALFAQDTYAPNNRLRFLFGLRLDGYNFLLPSDPQNPPAVDGLRHQRLYEPHSGVSYQLGQHDAVRANFGRSLSIPLPTFIGSNIDRSAYSAYANIPSFDSVTGKAATYCGAPQPVTFDGFTQYLGTQTCKSYADQLYWLTRDARYAAQSQITSPLQGATFTNYDFSYSHEFRNRSAVKLTPFYRRGYNVVETSRTLLGLDPSTGAEQLSPEVSSNLGIQEATGVELDVTSPPVRYGLSGQISLTYINQIGNDPPGDYLPTASVQLGELYHSPNLSPLQSTLALTYRTKSGFKVNPIFTVHSGYPYGVGVYQALTINGQPYYVPNTPSTFIPGNFPGQVVGSATTNPQYPGLVTDPNVVATRGAELATAGPGSLYSRPSLNIDLTLEYAPPGSHLTFGFAVQNLTNLTVNYPVRNLTQNCVLIYTGLCAASYLDSTQAALAVGGANNPYIYSPNQPPRSIRFYTQARL